MGRHERRHPVQPPARDQRARRRLRLARRRARSPWPPSAATAPRCVCLSYGERGESAKAWREGKSLEEIKRIRRAEARGRGGGARRGDRVPGRRGLPAASRPPSWSTGSSACTGTSSRPWCSPTRSPTPTTATTPRRRGWRCRRGCWPRPSGTTPPASRSARPPVFFFEPHQPEQCDFKPERPARHHRRCSSASAGRWSACPPSSTCGSTTPTWPGAAACSSGATRARTWGCRTTRRPRRTCGCTRRSTGVLA